MYIFYRFNRYFFQNNCLLSFYILSYFTEQEEVVCFCCWKRSVREVMSVLLFHRLKPSQFPLTPIKKPKWRICFCDTSEGTEPAPPLFPQPHSLLLFCHRRGSGGSPFVGVEGECESFAHVHVSDLSMRWHGNHQSSSFDCLFTRGSCQYKASCNKNHCSVQISSDLSRSHVFLHLKIGSVNIIGNHQRPNSGIH